MLFPGIEWPAGRTKRPRTRTGGEKFVARVCVFDVNETLLDLSALDPLFERAFGDASARGEWFGQLQQSWLVATVTGVYEQFGTIGGTALKMVAERRGVSLPDEDASEILGSIRELPPHPEVGEALACLRNAGIRLATLTNSTQDVADAQIENSGLGEHFEQVLSADAVKRLKPAPEPYRMASEILGVEIGQVRLVAAHAWDVAGAMRAGCAAAFVARPGKVLDPLFEPPDVVGVDLREVAGRLLEAEIGRA
jgi:2-haloacid dehalogenase